MDDKEERQLIADLLGRVRSGDISIDDAVDFLRLKPLVRVETAELREQIPSGKKNKVGRPKNSARDREIQYTFFALRFSYGFRHGVKKQYYESIGKFYNLSDVKGIKNISKNNPFILAEEYLVANKILPVPVGCEIGDVLPLLPEIAEGVRLGNIDVFHQSDFGINLSDCPDWSLIFININNL